MRRWASFLLPLALPGKRGRDSCSSRWQNPSSLAGSPRSASITGPPWPCRGTGTSWLRLGVCSSARSCARVGRRGQGSLYSSPRHMTPPEVLLLLQRAPARGRRWRTKQRVFGPISSVREAAWRWGRFGTHGERPQVALAQPCASVRGGAGPRDGRTRRANAALGRSFALRGADSLRPSWATGVDRDTAPGWRGGGGESSSSPDWWTEGAYHRRLPPPEPFAGFHSLDPEPPLDFHLLWRESNPLLPLIGFVVEGWDWVLLVFSFFLPFNFEPPAPTPKKEKGR